MIGPDFLCIGMQKAGTSWLFDQLQYHPDFWMPPVKELHYFDKNFPEKKLTRTMMRAEKSISHLEELRWQKNLRPIDERDLKFFAAVEACRGRGPNIATYASLFKPKDDLLSGDITPALCALPDRRIEEITNYLPEVKVILLIRDPVMRALSQISMSFRNKEFKSSWVHDASEFQAFLESRSVEVRSFPTQIYDKWAKFVPEARFKVFFFDDMATRPEQLRGEILEFLGADPNKESGKLGSDFDRKSDQERLEMTDLVRDLLVKHFAKEIRKCVARFGGPAKDWAAKYGLS